MDFTKPVYGQKKLILCGHRGDRTGADENTMASFQRAIKAGCDMIETDLHLTLDGEVVLRHDAFIEGAGLIRDHTWEELKAAKPDLPRLKDLCGLMAGYPETGLLIELKDVPESSPGGNAGKVRKPAPYSGKVNECSGLVFGPSDGEKPLAADLKGMTDPGAGRPDGDMLSKQCADRAAEILLSHGLGERTFILSFSGKILEYVYNRYGRRFHYHAFYPWFIMGDMEKDPASFCELACMQHRYLGEDGTVIRYEDPLCPESWWEDVNAMGIVPIGAPSLETDENYLEAAGRGMGMVNANDPVHLKELLKTDL